MRYTAPTPEALRDLKDRFGYTGKQMAELFSLGGDRQWRKYTGGQAPREMGLPMLFMAAARITLNAPQVERVIQRMRWMGADVSLGPDTDEP